MTENLYALFAPAIRRDPAKPAITVEGQGGLTFGELDSWSGRLANAFASIGLTQGERVAVQIAKSPMAIAVHLACLRAGLIYISLNTAYTPHEMEYFISDSEASLVICDPAKADDLSQTAAPGVKPCKLLTLGGDGTGSLVTLAEAHGDDFDDIVVAGDAIACVIYTSGTTGKPKGAMLTHANLASGATTLSNFWGFSETDILLHPLPIFHGHGLFVACHSALLHGCTTHFINKFDTAKVVALLPRSTVMMAVPTIYARLVEDPAFTREVCAGVRLFTSGSAALSDKLFSDFETRTGHRLLERYGATETLICTSNPLHGQRKPGTVGRALPGIELRIADEQDRPLPSGTTGGVQVRGPNVFAGYWGRPDATAADFTADGYFRQGDLGRVDADGYLSIVGRTKDLIISGGYNVYPLEIEAALEAIDGVSEAAVFGVPHPDFGEAVVGALVADPAVTDSEILSAARVDLAAFKLPKEIVRLEALPRNAMGKILKPELRARYADLFMVATR